MSNYFGTEIVASAADLDHKIYSINQATTLDSSAYGNTYVVKSPANFTINLPALQPVSMGKVISFIHDFASGTVTLAAYGSDVIRVGGTSNDHVTLSKGQSISFENTADSWRVVADAGVHIPASANSLGGVKVGTGLAVTDDGTLSVSATDPYQLPVATTTVLGGVKVGYGLFADTDGTVSVVGGGGGVGGMPSTGGTFTGNVGLKTVDYARVDLGSVTGAATIDLTAANYIQATVAGAVTFSITGAAAAGRAQVFMLELINGGAFTVTWPASVTFPAGTPTFKTSGTDILVFVTDDAGVTWRAGFGLAGTTSGGSGYTLPAATTSALGGVKVGFNLAVTADGTLSVADKVATVSYGVMDLSAGSYHKLTVSSATTLSLYNAVSSVVNWFVLEVTNGGAFALTYPSSFKFDGGTAPTLQTSGVDILVGSTRDGGANWYISRSWRAA